jgi:ribosome biogenesis SPOUT family RNA methylase Rps3
MKIEFEDKENLGISPRPRKNKITAQDLNEIKQSVNDLYDQKQDNIIVLTQSQYNALNPVDETKIYFIVG